MGDVAAEHEGLTQNELTKLQEAFSIWDRQQGGFIPWKPDFASLWRSIGQNPTEAELKEIIDANNTETGHFSLDQFLRICESDNPRWMKDPLRPEQLIEAFKVFDKDGRGVITTPQLRYMLQCLGDKLDDAEADDFINFADKEQTGEIDYQDLVEALMERNPNNA
mmetsp:Transcript_64191/g.180683  ORF Transcript_64191/g.180683 Transcript_64191/m.180683 type:complete len:165 (-) Transcript_64191:135-629(-)